MKILLSHSGSDLYGASRSLLRLASRLTQDGHDVLVVLPSEGPLVGALDSAGVPVKVHKWMAVLTREAFRSAQGRFRLLVSMPLSLCYFWWTIVRFGPDVVHTNTAVCLSSGVAARLRGKPHVWHIREFFTDFPRLWPVYRRFIEHNADVIVCVSHAVSGQFAGGPGQVIVCHNGFPREEFEDVADRRVREFREAHGLGDARLVGIVGRIKCGRKGQDVFVRAASLVADQIPDVRFVIVGSPYPGNESHLKRVEELVDELGLGSRVVFTGDVVDIKAAYRALSISVLASAQPEPFGGVVIESMALGVPVIGTRIGGTPEQISDHVTGLLVDPDDPQDLAQAIATLLCESTDLSRMGQAAKQRFLDCFEFEPFYARMCALYQHATHG